MWDVRAVSTPLTSEVPHLQNQTGPTTDTYGVIWHIHFTQPTVSSWIYRCKMIPIQLSYTSSSGFWYCLHSFRQQKMVDCVLLSFFLICICQSQMLKRWLWKVAMERVACRGSQTALGSIIGQCRKTGDSSLEHTPRTDKNKKNTVTTKRLNTHTKKSQRSTAKHQTDYYAQKHKDDSVKRKHFTINRKEKYGHKR